MIADRLLLAPGSGRSASRRSALRGAFGWAAASLVPAACSSDPPSQKTTALEFGIEADREINLNETGEANPIVLRIYELKALSAFEQAQFFDLLDSDIVKLGPDLVSRKEFELRPGDRKSYTRRAPAEAKHVGILAAYRDLDASTWRASADIVEDRTNRFVIAVGAREASISLVSADRDFSDLF